MAFHPLRLLLVVGGELLVRRDEGEKHNVSVPLRGVAEKRVGAVDSVEQAQHSVVVVESKIEILNDQHRTSSPISPRKKLFSPKSETTHSDRKIFNGILRNKSRFLEFFPDLSNVYFKIS